MTFEFSHQLAETQNTLNPSPFYLQIVCRHVVGSYLRHQIGPFNGSVNAAAAPAAGPERMWTPQVAMLALHWPYSSDSGSTSITSAVAGHLCSSAKVRILCNSALSATRLADLMSN